MIKACGAPISYINKSIYIMWITSKCLRLICTQGYVDVVVSVEVVDAVTIAVSIVIEVCVGCMSVKEWKKLTNSEVRTRTEYMLM